VNAWQSFQIQKYGLERLLQFCRVEHE